MKFSKYVFTDEEVFNIEKIEQRFGNDYILTGKHNLAYNCPFCESIRNKADNDHKFMVDAKTTLYFCFKCHSKGIILSKDKISYGERIIPFMMDYFKVNDSYIIDNQSNKLLKLNDAIKIEKNTVAYDYLKNRNITLNDIEYYNILNGIKSNFGRIILPNVYIAGWTDYYQGRTYLDSYMKYKNPDNSDKSNIVYNLHNQSKYQKIVYIVEGVFSAIQGGKDCICIYGSSISKEQIELINDYNFEEIVCSLDGDSAGQTGNMIMAMELSKNNNVSIVKLPETVDPADMGEYKFKEYISKHKRKYINKKVDTIFSYFD